MAFMSEAAINVGCEVWRRIWIPHWFTADFVPVDVEARLAKAIIRLTCCLGMKLASEHFARVNFAKERGTWRVVRGCECWLKLPGLVFVLVAIPNNEVAATLENASFHIKAELVERLDCRLLDDPVLAGHVMAWVKANITSPARTFYLKTALIPCHNVICLDKESLARLPKLAFFQEDVAINAIGNTKVIESCLDRNPFTVMLQFTLRTIKTKWAGAFTLVIFPRDKTAILAV